MTIILEECGMRRLLSVGGRILILALAVWGLIALVWPVVSTTVQWRPVWSIRDDYLMGRQLAEAQPGGMRVGYCDALAEAKYGKSITTSEPGSGPAMDQTAFQVGCDDVVNGHSNRVNTLGFIIGGE